GGKGPPWMAEGCMVRPPAARLGPITPDERKALMAKSPVKGKYDQAVDSESAYELLQKRLQSGAASGPIVAPPGPGGAEQAQPSGLGGVLGGIGSVLGDIFGTTRPRRTRLSTGQVVARGVTRSVSNRVAGQIAADIGKSIGGKMGSSVGRAIVRGTMGGILRRWRLCGRLCRPGRPPAIIRGRHPPPSTVPAPPPSPRRKDCPPGGDSSNNRTGQA